MVRQLGQRSGEGPYLADGADDLEALGAGLELGPLGFLVLLGITPLRVDLLLPARHPHAAAALPPQQPVVSSSFPAIGFGSAPALAVEG